VSGAPLALLHGFTGSPTSWDAVRAALPSELEVHALPLPGHAPDFAVPWLGEQSADEARWGASVDAVAERLPARPAVLVGYSLGARLALGLLARHPARVASAVLIGVSPGLADAEARRLRILSDAVLARRLREEGIEAFERHWASLPIFSSQGRVPASARAAQRARRLAHDPEQLARSLETVGLGRMPELSPILDAEASRLRLVVGAEDAKFRAIAEAAARRCPALGVGLVPESGHDVPLEAPIALADGIAATARGRAWQLAPA
jgi:2-succinyl-6-hydroxy-2,4-cyclohexadiene-1-carboxylate synthase